VSRPPAEGGLLPVGGIAWRINREAVVLAGGSCALLMQLSHPSVAAGVAQHSDFQSRPFGRLRRTLVASYAIAFDSPPGSDRAIRHLNSIHAAVRGVEPESGRPYDALDSDLQLWVHATLVDTAARVYDRFVTPLSTLEADAFVREMHAPAVALGIRAADLPDSLADLRAWMAEQVASGEVRVGETARGLLPAVLYPVPGIPRWLWDAAHLVSLSTLDSAIRRQYGLGWTPARERGVERLARASRRVLPLLPVALRVVPHARLRLSHRFNTAC
jgi:uncharacterized protein (DUF2236 family)